MKKLIQWLLSQLSPAGMPELPEHVSDNLIPSAELIQTIKNPEGFKLLNEV